MNMDERKLTIDWVGTEGSVRGNIAFTTDRSANIVLTADEIDRLHKASIEARNKNQRGNA